MSELIGQLISFASIGVGGYIVYRVLQNKYGTGAAYLENRVVNVNSMFADDQNYDFCDMFGQKSPRVVKLKQVNNSLFQVDFGDGAFRELNLLAVNEMMKYKDNFKLIRV
jgi:hypothetical protein